MNNLKEQTIKKLEEIKNNLSYDMEENYRNMVNTIIDYDNEAQDNLYLYDTVQELIEFVDDETLEYYIDYQIKTFGKDRYFYMFNNVTNVCGIYVVDAYGNLRDIEKDDIIYCIDEIIIKLKESMEVNHDEL